MKRLLLMLALLCGVASGQSLTGSITATGATCSTTAACVDLQMPSGDAGSATILVTGTWVATLQFEASVDGITYAAINFVPPNSTSPVTSATANGTWQGNVAGYKNVRVRCSAFTSGTAVVTINSSKGMAKSGGGAVYASGLGTSNVIPKGNGAGQLQDSCFLDDGTTVTCAEVINLSHAGSASNAILELGGVATTGLMFGSSAAIGLKVDATNWMIVASTGSNQIQAPSTGGIGWSSTTTFAGNNSDLVLRRVGAASLVQGLPNSATPIAQTFTLGESSRGGTDSNVAGASGTVKPGIGTGTGAGTKYCIQRDIMGASGSTAQSTIDGYCVGPSKTLSNTTATAQSLVNISVPSNSAAGVEGTITVTCTDGTNFDSETQSFNTSVVNKAGALTIGGPVITATSAANNSGSCTAGITVVAGTNSIDIKVTPAFTTIVPTTVTSYIALRNNGIGNATFN